MAAYRGMWEAYAAASDRGTADAPELAKYTADRVLAKLRKGLALNKSKGLKTKGSLKMDPKPTEVGPVAAPTSVSLLDCVDSSDWLLYKADGQLADDVPGGRRKVTVKVDKAGDGWKVVSFAAHEVGSC